MCVAARCFTHNSTLRLFARPMKKRKRAEGGGLMRSLSCATSFQAAHEFFAQLLVVASQEGSTSSSEPAFPLNFRVNAPEHPYDSLKNHSNSELQLLRACGEHGCVEEARELLSPFYERGALSTFSPATLDGLKRSFRDATLVCDFVEIGAGGTKNASGGGENSLPMLPPPVPCPACEAPVAH